MTLSLSKRSRWNGKHSRIIHLVLSTSCTVLEGLEDGSNYEKPVDGLIGKDQEPGETFSLLSAEKATERVKWQCEESGISYTGKAMIICGLALNSNGLWEEQQETPKWQSIIGKHRHNFDGEAVSPQRDDTVPSSAVNE